MQKVNSWNIFKAFFKIGAILLGGGYVIIPIMKQELVEKRNWLSDDEVCDYYCVSQCLPGIIAVNMSILVGYKLRKIKGMFASIFGMTLSPFVSIVIVANLLSKIMSISFIEGLFWGVNLSVIVLIYLTLKEMWQKSIVDIFSFIWFLIILLLAIFKVSPAILIIVSIILGLLIEKARRMKNGDIYNWFSHQELTQLIAISGITPGPIGLNMATFSGFQTLGIKGAFISSFALILPMMIITSQVFRLYKKFSENQYVKSVLYVLRPTSCALILSVGAKLFYNLVLLNALSLKTLDLKALFLVVLLFALTFKLKRDPITYMAIAGFVGILFQFVNKF